MNFLQGNDHVLISQRIINDQSKKLLASWTPRKKEGYMKEFLSDQESSQHLSQENIKKIGRKFIFLPLILGVFVAQWQGTKAIIPILIVGALVIIPLIFLSKFLKKK